MAIWLPERLGFRFLLFGKFDSGQGFEVRARSI